MLNSGSLARIALLVVLGVSLAGCEVIGGIFKAGVWVGALAVIVVVVLGMFLVARDEGLTIRSAGSIAGSTRAARIAGSRAARQPLVASAMRHRCQRERVGWIGLEQERSDDARRGHRAADPEHGADHDRHGGITEHRADDLRRARAKRHPHADLRRSPRHRIRGHAEDANQRECKAKTSQQAEQHHPAAGRDDAIAEILVGETRRARPARAVRSTARCRAARCPSTPSGPHGRTATITGALRSSSLGSSGKNICSCPIPRRSSGPPCRRSRITALIVKLPDVANDFATDRAAWREEFPRRRLVDDHAPRCGARHPRRADGPRSRARRSFRGSRAMLRRS